MRPSDAPSRRLLRPWDRSSGTGASKLAIQAGFRPPFACTPQPLKAEPRSGLGRLPKAPRVCACEAQPRAPHPTGSGYPSPAKLSLCPTSVTPLEAPLIGQDTSRIREVLETGIGIHSHFRERQFFVARMECSAIRKGPERARRRIPGLRFAPSGLQSTSYFSNASKRSPHERRDMWDCGTRTYAS
ncbi:MAG: hypothetical protein QOJ96_3814 [Alphaproteobacteria bacterium]|nr:hypothetical protein [Alphaproteobacteria bacterium]